MRAFCRDEGLRESAFYFWRRKLARRGHRAGVANGSRSTSAPHSSKRALKRHVPTPSFLPVHVVKHGLAEAPPGVEIILGQGRTVRVRAGFDRQTLADVLAVLGVQPC